MPRLPRRRRSRWPQRRDAGSYPRHGAKRRSATRRPAAEDDRRGANHRLDPSAGFLLGAAARVAVFRGDPSTTHYVGHRQRVVLHQKQLLANVRFDTFSDGNRWFVQGDNRFQSTSQDVYGFGTATPSSAAVSTDYGFVRIHETVYRQTARDVYLGGGFLFDSHTSVEPADASNPTWPSSPYIAYSEQNGLPIDGQQSSGVSLNVLLNRRDSDINARRGWRASARYRLSFEGFLGGDSSWQQFDTDVRVYLPLEPRAYIASRSGLRQLDDRRGASTRRDVMDIYGRRRAAIRTAAAATPRCGEAEYRAPLANGLLGVVAFDDDDRLNRQTGEALFDAVAPSAGGGLRLLLNGARGPICVSISRGQGWRQRRMHGLRRHSDGMTGRAARP
jgi:hypothetical protein